MKMNTLAQTLAKTLPMAKLCSRDKPIKGTRTPHNANRKIEQMQNVRAQKSEQTHSDLNGIIIYRSLVLNSAKQT